jgi:hypothetical protein
MECQKLGLVESVNKETVFTWQTPTGGCNSGGLKLSLEIQLSKYNIINWKHSNITPTFRIFEYRSM